MSLNYPNHHLAGLMGLSEKYEKLMRPAARLSESALAMSAARALKIAHPYLKMQERLDAMLPKPADFSALLDSPPHARSIAGQLQSLAALTRPFEHQLAALRTPTSEWAVLRQSGVDTAPFRALQHQQTQLAVVGQQLTESIRGVQHFADLLRPRLELLASGGLWSSRLLEWADLFDAAAAGFDEQPEPGGEDVRDDAAGGAGTTGLAGTLHA